MISTVVRVQVEKDGTFKLPLRLWEEMGVEPPREIELTVRIPTHSISRVPKKLSGQERAKFEHALRLLQASMKGVDTAEMLKQIREGRRDRWF